MKRMKLTFLSIAFLLLISGQCFAHSWMAPDSAAKIQNPIESNETSINNGKQQFESYCIACHGENASGISKTTTGLNMDTPNLPKRLATHTDGDFHWKILNGRNEMPSFKENLSESEIWDIINYIKSLTRK